VRSLSADVRESGIDRAVRAQAASPARFLVKNAAHYLVVSEAKVFYFASEDGLTRLVSDGGQYWMDPTLNELEQRLAPDRFCRISRSALINLAAVAEVHPLPGGSGEVLLKNGQRLEVSRRRFRELLAALGS
jgi:DNA-binding LytR/AlgR family response regulator